MTNYVCVCVCVVWNVSMCSRCGCAHILFLDRHFTAFTTNLQHTLLLFALKGPEFVSWTETLFLLLLN
jgi:hypothetical protein